jgi:succinoglycan biosynthesis protein ExoA
MRCFFTPRVRVRYHPRDTLAGLFRQMVRYGRGRMRLLRKHPDTFSVPGFVPAAFLAGVVFGPLLACWSAWLGVLYAGALGAYALAVLLCSVALAVRARELALLPLLPVVFLAVHFGAGAGVWWEALAGRARAASDTAELLPRGDQAASASREAA